MKIGLIGFGKAGSAVANVLAAEPGFSLVWIATRTGLPDTRVVVGQEVPVLALTSTNVANQLERCPVDAVVDFSNAESVWQYADSLARHPVMLVTAISAYGQQHLARLRELAKTTRVLCSPNITLGINFLMLAARLLRSVAPFADVEILEQHFKEKPEVSGTARKLAASLDVDASSVTSMRLGGIVGHHEVIFGFPYQTVRLVHDSIKREAFGTGTVFALKELASCKNGFYTFEDLLLQRMRQQLLAV